MKSLTVATRAGKLALAQTRIIIRLLEKIHPGLQIKIKKITTEGDINRKTSLWQLKSTGFFTSKIEDSLLAGLADFAVHSFKDLPTKQTTGLKIIAVCARSFPEDCLVSAEKIISLNQLKTAAKIGTSSLRRAVQIKRLRSDLNVVPVRGNVTTRIKKVDEGRFDAVILARAGLERINLARKISFCFDPEQFLPAPAQGALAVQTRADDKITNKLLLPLNDKNVEIQTLAERQILTATRCGCRAPVGAFAKISADDITITAFISDTEGKNFIKRQVAGPADSALNLADTLAGQLLDAGGKKILEQIKTNNG
ncbi:Porphobilinogen deaminase [subsurface metagenome]